jgi:choline dehydrogenase-like flavoprotein
MKTGGELAMALRFEKTYDVVVAGGGVAGAAAALEAARAGVRTALLEKTVQAGGLATSGMVNIYLPLCDGCGRQVTFGIAEEMFRLSVRYGPGDEPPGWREGAARFETPFSPAAFALALDEELEAAGVDVWLDTLACLPVLEGGRVAGLEVENKSGRGLLRAGCVVDATGDADVVSRAGGACAEGDNWLSVWATQSDAQTASRAMRLDPPRPPVDIVRLGADAAGAGAVPGGTGLRGVTGEQVTRFARGGQRLLREHYRSRQADGEHARHAVFPLALPSMAQFRTIRRIAGREEMTDGQHTLRRPASIGLAADWRRPGQVWEIPFGALLPLSVAGVLAAGRCIASGGDAWEVTRVIPAAALTGQAAGMAAWMAVKAGIQPHQLAVGGLQRQLARAGVPAHLEDVGLAAAGVLAEAA